MSKKVVIYHSGDLDGWTSGAIVNYWFKQMKEKLADSKTSKFDIGTLDFISWDYGDEIPNLDKYDEIYISDICFEPDIMYKLNKEKTLIWNDHHKGAIDKMTDYFKEKNEKLPLGNQNTKYAACELTWQWFFKDRKIPKTVEYLGLYDSFRHKKLSKKEENDVMAFQYACRSFYEDYNDFDDNFFEDSSLLKKYISEGAYIFNYVKKNAKSIYENRFDMTIDGYKICMINFMKFNPATFDINYHKDGYDGAISFYIKDDVINCSIYSEGKIDCVKFAKKYKGGGHVSAAGMQINIKDFDKYF